jgi:FlaA1/EpsC-like NDP-sugar epimerase
VVLVSLLRLRNNRRALRNRYLVVFDLIGCLIGLSLAYAIRFETFEIGEPHRGTLLRVLPWLLGFKVLVFYRAGLYRRLWRHAGVVELERILTASGVAAVATAVLGGWLLPALGLAPVRVPISVLVLDAVLTPVIVTAPRFLGRWLSHRESRNRNEGIKVLIAGAGSAGELIARELRTNLKLGLVPVGFVDDDGAKHGLEMQGLPVLGPIDRLVDFRERFRADEIIIAMPSAPGSVIREAMRKAQQAGLRARTIPGMFEILSGRAGISTLRPIQIEDLLRREPVRTDLDRVHALIEERTILVTGAGGSIGSELCRQVARLNPGRLVVLGHGENSIFGITNELAERHPGLVVSPVIADVRDAERISRIIDRFRPSTVFHAAAHKHVPLMEVNVAEAVTNNVQGTRNVVLASARAGVERFVMVSTDKAVRPTNVMGASKRVAEQIVQETADHCGQNYIAVRFGNVLGSRGSVVPTFLRQIEDGGPVTVTHPEMRRYFMTIPEAVQLVLQAAVLGRGGEVFVLDMGEPVRIVDLATDLIRLSGFEVGRDIEIHFTGVRPGEKLYEELFFGREHAEPTEHPKVLRARHADLPIGLSSVVDDLVHRAVTCGTDDELRRLLCRLVPDYHPEDSAHNISAVRAEAPTTPLTRDRADR